MQLCLTQKRFALLMRRWDGHRSMCCREKSLLSKTMTSSGSSSTRIAFILYLLVCKKLSLLHARWVSTGTTPGVMIFKAVALVLSTSCTVSNRTVISSLVFGNRVFASVLFVSWVILRRCPGSGANWYFVHAVSRFHELICIYFSLRRRGFESHFRHQWMLRIHTCLWLWMQCLFVTR